MCVFQAAKVSYEWDVINLTVLRVCWDLVLLTKHINFQIIRLSHKIT